MSGEFRCNPHFEFDPPPRACDVDYQELGPYPHHEVVRARSTLIHAIRTENNLFWRNIKAKCGILPSGHRLRQDCVPHMWLPQEIPDSWHAPISLVHVIEDDQKELRQRTRKNVTSTASSRSRGENIRSNSSSPVICIDAGPDEENDIALSSTSQSGTGSSSAGSSRRGSDFNEVIITEASLTSLFDKNGTDPSNSDINSKLNQVNRNCKEAGEVVWLDNRFDGETRRINKDWNGGISGAEKVNPSMLTQPSAHLRGGLIEHERVTREPYQASDLRTVNDYLNANSSQSTSSNTDRQQSNVNVGDKFVTMYKCDICSSTFHIRGEAQQHLKSLRHYSASSYLGEKGAYNKLTPVYTQSLCVLKCKQGLYNEKVPACPVCHEVFPDIALCCEHTRDEHGQNGSYILRGIKRQKTFLIPSSADKCVCGETFALLQMESHWIQTDHMPVNVPTRDSSVMSFFFCELCCQEFHSFLKCHEHVQKMHQDVHGDRSVTMYTLEPATSPMTVLPFLQGIERGNPENGVDINSKPTATVKGPKRKAQVFEDSLKRLRTENPNLNPLSLRDAC